MEASVSYRGQDTPAVDDEEERRCQGARYRSRRQAVCAQGWRVLIE